MHLGLSTKSLLGIALIASIIVTVLGLVALIPLYVAGKVDSILFSTFTVFWLTFFLNLTFQILLRLSSISELRINYDSNKNGDYSLYHHIDVPSRHRISPKFVNTYPRYFATADSSCAPADTGGFVHKSEEASVPDKCNFILIGLENIGRGIAKNCYAKLWIYTDSDYQNLFDNPYPLYLSHDPNSDKEILPSPFHLGKKDEEFLTICYTRSNGEFVFSDYGQFTSLRQEKLKQLPAEFHIRIVAYCDNSSPTERRFIIKNLKDYGKMEMKEAP